MLVNENFIVITERIVVTSYRHFGITYRSRLKGQEVVTISYRRFATTLEVGTDLLCGNVVKKLKQHAM